MSPEAPRDAPRALLALAEAAADVVRAASRRLHLASGEDVLDGLEALGLVGGREQAELPARAAVAPLLPTLLAGQPGLESLTGLDGRTLHYVPDLLSRTYARILASRGSPLRLMAEEIRLNSRDYPRPVPVELFEAPPFGLAPSDIEQALRSMVASPGHGDIAFITTPSGAVYLFSTLHLEPSYARFLALRAESLAENP